MNQYAATEIIPEVCNTKELQLFQEDCNHPTDFSTKTNTLHVHLLFRIFYKGMYSNYVPQKWKYSRNIWILTQI